MSFKATPDVVEANLNSMKTDVHLGTLQLPKITSQQRYYVAARVGGMNQTAAAREAGVAPGTGNNWEHQPAVQEHFQHYTEEFSSKVLPRVQFSMEQAHQMYMNSYHCAGTSAEMTRATDSLVKLHKLLDITDEDRHVPVNAKQLEQLNTRQLLQYAAIGMDSLRPGDIVDGEHTEGADDEAEDGGTA